MGGAGEVYAALARAANGRITVLCASRDAAIEAEIPGWADWDAAAGFPVHRIPFIRPPLRRRPNLADRAREAAIRLRLLATVMQLHRRYGFRAVCIADDETNGWLMRPLRMLGIRILLYTHGDDLAVRAGQERLRARRARQFARADAIIAVSQASADELCRVFGGGRRVTVIPNGVDLDVFHPMVPDEALRARLELVGSRVLVTVSRLVPRKGIDRVIEALPLIRARQPNLVYLVIGEGPQAAELRSLAARNGVADCVRFLGAIPHEQVPGYLALCNVFVMPNRREPDGSVDGFGLVFLEANACGLAVVGGRAGGVPEVVEDGVNGLLVDGESVEEIAGATIRLLTDTDVAARLAQQGQQRALRAGSSERADAFLRLCG